MYRDLGKAGYMRIMLNDDYIVYVVKTIGRLNVRDRGELRLRITPVGLVKTGNRGK